MVTLRNLCALAVLLAPLPAAAVRLGDGSTAFVGAPRLLRSAASISTFDAYPVYYQFSVELPVGLDEALGRLAIDIPTENGDFGLVPPPTPDQVRAFVPTEPYAQAPQSPARVLPARALTSRAQVVLDFAPPVQPGQVVTVEWGPLRNPYQDGNYLYALTAYPAGPSPHGQFLGYGRIVIRRGGRGQGRGYPSSQPHQEITGNLWLLGAQIEKERLQSGRFPPGAGKPGYISIFKTASGPW